MTTIALLEDESTLREEIADFLTSRGHRVRQAGSLAEFGEAMQGARLVILDVMLPDGTGHEAVHMARTLHKQVGIVTARGSLEDRLAGFAGGADHYLVKPVDLLELEAIVEALLRRIGADWVFRESTSELIDPQGRRLLLTRQECVLFRAVIGAGAGTVVQRRQIVEALGGDWASYDLRRLDTMVSRLRTRWRLQTGEELPLRTLHREGYSFGAAVSRL